jgi:hypothetical protein
MVKKQSSWDKGKERERGGGGGKRLYKVEGERKLGYEKIKRY